MALGKSKTRQTALFIPTAQLAKGPGHPFYTKLNAVLAEAGFDAFVEQLCAPHYKEGGRPGLPPGICFRMLFIGYFEGIGSQRGIVVRRGPIHPTLSPVASRPALDLAHQENHPLLTGC